MGGITKVSLCEVSGRRGRESKAQWQSWQAQCFGTVEKGTDEGVVWGKATQG
jgi:hypothetical protein